MKIFKLLLIAIIMIMSISVGLGRNSPPKNAPFDHNAFNAVQPAIIVAPQMNVTSNEVVIIHSIAYAAENASGCQAITPKVITLPAPVAIRLSRYIHYNLITDYSIKKIEARARSSDIFNQNRRC